MGRYASGTVEVVAGRPVVLTQIVMAKIPFACTFAELLVEQDQLFCIQVHFGLPPTTSLIGYHVEGTRRWDGAKSALTWLQARAFQRT
jgi:hypothetical protein